MLNCFYVQEKTKVENRKEYFSYEKIFMLQKFSIRAFTNAIEKGYVYVDFDVRTGHNHGTKFRLRQDKFPELYEDIQIL